MTERLIAMMVLGVLAPSEAYCSACGRFGAVVPIRYGKPGPELMERARIGDVVLGGCEPAPWRWACATDGHAVVTEDIDWARWAAHGESALQARDRWLSGR